MEKAHDTAQENRQRTHLKGSKCFVQLFFIPGHYSNMTATLRYELGQGKSQSRTSTSNVDVLLSDTQSKHYLKEISHLSIRIPFFAKHNATPN
jgi:hypothetical protein